MNDKWKSKNEKEKQEQEKSLKEEKEEDERYFGKDDKSKGEENKKESGIEKEKEEIGKIEDNNETEKIEEIDIKEKKINEKVIRDEFNLKNFPIIQIKPLINMKKKFNEIIINIDIYGEGIETLLDQIYEEKPNENIISIFNSILSLKINDKDSKEIINSNFKPKILDKNLKLNKELRENKLFENLRLNNEEKIKNMFENMCALGNRIKNEIIEEKKRNSDKFISIEEAINNNKKIDELFCIGLLAKNLENFGIITAIEKNPNQDEETIKLENTFLHIFWMD